MFGFCIKNTSDNTTINNGIYNAATNLISLSYKYILQCITTLQI